MKGVIGIRIMDHQVDFVVIVIAERKTENGGIFEFLEFVVLVVERTVAIVVVVIVVIFAWNGNESTTLENVIFKRSNLDSTKT